MGAMLVWACSGAAMADPWTPDAQTIAKLESVVRLPDLGHSDQYPNGHVPAVTDYARYYAGDISMGANGTNSRHIVFAQLVMLDAGTQPGIHMVATIADFPQIANGGCGIINLIYDVDQAQVIGLRCNDRR
jgi:hypothetical protein